jgi:hypothetical protein
LLALRDSAATIINIAPKERQSLSAHQTAEPDVFSIALLVLHIKGHAAPLLKIAIPKARSRMGNHSATVLAAKPGIV